MIYYIALDYIRFQQRYGAIVHVKETDKMPLHNALRCWQLEPSVWAYFPFVVIVILRLFWNGFHMRGRKQASAWGSNRIAVICSSSDTILPQHVLYYWGVTRGGVRIVNIFGRIFIEGRAHYSNIPQPPLPVGSPCDNNRRRVVAELPYLGFGRYSEV